MKDIENLEQGKIYYTLWGNSTPMIFECNKNTSYCRGIRLGNYLDFCSDLVLCDKSYFHKHCNLREATKEERHHLECCIKENKFVPLQEALKSLNKFEVGRWYKINNCWWAKFLKLEKNDWRMSESITAYGTYMRGSFSIDLDDSNRNPTLLTDLSEIQQYLPSDHPDKLVKQQLMNKHNLVVGKYYTFKGADENIYWFRFKELLGSSVYGSGFRNNGKYLNWTEGDFNLTNGNTFKEVTEQEAKGIAALPHEIPNNQPKVNDSNTQYWECIDKGGSLRFTVGKIYKLVEGKTINSYSPFIDDTGKENGFSRSNSKFFKPSTETAYNAQNQIVKQTTTITSTGTQFEYWTNYKNGYIQLDPPFQKPKTPKECYPLTITIKNRTKKEEKPLTKTRTKLTILKPQIIKL